MFYFLLLLSFLLFFISVVRVVCSTLTLRCLINYIFLLSLLYVQYSVFLLSFYFS